MWKIYEVKMELVPLGCFSARTKLILHFQRQKKARLLRYIGGLINRASVLGFRANGGGHAAASKVFSFLGLSPMLISLSLSVDAIFKRSMPSFISALVSAWTR